MKRINYGLLIFSLAGAFAVTICSRLDQAKWRGTIEEVAGVTVIKNPKEPIFNENIFELKEELFIQGENSESEEEMFQDIVSLAVDEEQNIYALDGKAANVKVFDKTGSFLKSIGRRGEGPGEFGRPQNILISPRQEIVIEDAGRRLIHFLDLGGKYLRQWSLNWVFSSGPKFTSQGEVFDPQGRYLTNVILPPNMLPCVFQKGRLFTIEETDEGFEVVKGYRIIWKD
jgi:hypothetical protein